MRAMVLGVGNILMTDEGVGVCALNALCRDYELPPEVVAMDGGTAGMEIVPEIQGLDHLIVLDAVRFGQPPASLVRLAGDDVPNFFKTKLSPHQVGLSDMLGLLTFAGDPPKNVVVIGAQPVSLELHMGLSPELSARLDDMVQMTVDELAAIGLPAKRKN